MIWWLIHTSVELFFPVDKDLMLFNSHLLHIMNLDFGIYHLCSSFYHISHELRHAFAMQWLGNSQNKESLHYKTYSVGIILFCELNDMALYMVIKTCCDFCTECSRVKCDKMLHLACCVIQQDTFFLFWWLISTSTCRLSQFCFYWELFVDMSLSCYWENCLSKLL